MAFGISLPTSMCKFLSQRIWEHVQFTESLWIIGCYEYVVSQLPVPFPCLWRISSFILLCCSVTKLCPNLCDPVNCSTSGFPSFTISRSWLKLMSIELVMLSNSSQPLAPFSFCCRSFPASGFFSNELGLCVRWPKYWSFTSASVFPMSIQGWFPLGLTGLKSLLSKGLS